MKKGIPFKNVENIDKVIKMLEVLSAWPYEWLK